MFGMHALLPWLRYKLNLSTKQISANEDFAALIEYLLHAEAVPYAFEYYLTYMEDLLVDGNTIHVNDQGAGSKKMGNEREVREIAKHSVLNEKEAEMLCRLLYALKPKRALELGTSLGASSLCMAVSSPQTEIHTIDACPETHAVAKYYLEPYQLNNVDFHTETFDAFLDIDNSVWDFVYMDGNHRYEPTMKMFNELLPRLSDNAVILMDDIHWSSGMSKAWKEIAKREGVQVVDLFDVGIVFAQAKS